MWSSSVAGTVVAVTERHTRRGVNSGGNLSLLGVCGIPTYAPLMTFLC